MNNNVSLKISLLSDEVNLLDHYIEFNLIPEAILFNTFLIKFYKIFFLFPYSLLRIIFKLYKYFTGDYCIFIS